MAATTCEACVVDRREITARHDRFLFWAERGGGCGERVAAAFRSLSTILVTCRVSKGLIQGALLVQERP